MQTPEHFTHSLWSLKSEPVANLTWLTQYWSSQTLHMLQTQHTSTSVTLLQQPLKSCILITHFRLFFVTLQIVHLMLLTDHSSTSYIVTDRDTVIIGYTFFLADPAHSCVYTIASFFLARTVCDFLFAYTAWNAERNSIHLRNWPLLVRFGRLQCCDSRILATSQTGCTTV